VTGVIWDLLLGLPDQRPGGLLLTVIVFFGSAATALVAGTLYATVCVEARWLGLGLQAALAVLRGVPLLLLMFVIAQGTTLPIELAGFLALFLYSLCHVGETLRSFLGAYPRTVRDQARLMGIGAVREWAQLRLPWTMRRSLDAVGTHWVSLLKDTGALTVLGITELTTVARVLSEQASVADWELILAGAALLYLGTSVALMRGVDLLQDRYALGGGAAS
jgi:ABC-type amino acid transport system permease subunit